MAEREQVQAHARRVAFGVAWRLAVRYTELLND